MPALLKVSLDIRTSVSVDIFYSNTNVAHQHQESSDNDGENDGSSAVTSTPPRARKSKVDTTTPKISMFLNQSADLKVGYFGNFNFVDIQRAHRGTFGDNPMIFPANPTNNNKTMASKEIYAFSELYMFDVFIHMIGIFMLVQIMLMVQGSHRRCDK